MSTPETPAPEAPPAETPATEVPSASEIAATLAGPAPSGAAPPVEPPRPKKIKFRPLHDRILVDPLPREEKTEGGIIIPDTAKKPMNKGIALKCGKGRWSENLGKRLPMEVKPGMTIVWQEWGGAPMKIQGREYVLVAESEVVGIEDEGSGEDVPQPKAFTPHTGPKPSG